jgi:hypothetical protein
VSAIFEAPRLEWYIENVYERKILLFVLLPARAEITVCLCFLYSLVSTFIISNSVFCFICFISGKFGKNLACSFLRSPTGKNGRTEESIHVYNATGKSRYSTSSIWKMKQGSVAAIQKVKYTIFSATFERCGFAIVVLPQCNSIRGSSQSVMVVVTRMKFPVLQRNNRSKDVDRKSPA